MNFSGWNNEFWRFLKLSSKQKNFILRVESDSEGENKMFEIIETSSDKSLVINLFPRLVSSFSDVCFLSIKPSHEIQEIEERSDVSFCFLSILSGILSYFKKQLNLYEMYEKVW